MHNITIGTYNTEEKTLCVIATFNRVNTNLSEKQFINYITNIANNFANLLEKDIVLVNRQDSNMVVDINDDETLIKISSRLKHLKEDDIDLMMFNKNIPENVGEYIKELENELQQYENVNVSELEEIEKELNITTTENNKLISALGDIKDLIDNIL